MSILNIPENNQTYTKSGAPGSTITIVARAKAGYEFDHWDDLQRGDPGYDSATRQYLIKPSGNDLVAKFRDKNLGAITAIASTGYSVSGTGITVDPPTTAADYEVTVKFDGSKEWAHEVRVSGLEQSDYQIVSHEKYMVRIKVLAKAIAKIQRAIIEFLDRFGQKVKMVFQAYSPTTYTVTANIEGATGTITKKPDRAVESGTLVTLTAPAASGKRFVGWFEGGRSVGNAHELSITVTSNRTLTAKYEQESYNNHFKVLTEYYLGDESVESDGSVPSNEKYVVGYKVVEKAEFDRVKSLNDIKSQLSETYFTSIGRSFPAATNKDQYVLAVPLLWVTVHTDGGNWDNVSSTVSYGGEDFKVDGTNEYTLYAYLHDDSNVSIGKTRGEGINVYTTSESTEGGLELD